MRLMQAAMILIAATLLGACNEPSLRALTKPGEGPDEFLITPSQPLEQPTELQQPSTAQTGRVEPHGPSAAARWGRGPGRATQHRHRGNSRRGRGGGQPRIPVRPGPCDPSDVGHDRRGLPQAQVAADADPDRAGRPLQSGLPRAGAGSATGTGALAASRCQDAIGATAIAHIHASTLELAPRPCRSRAVRPA